MKVLMLDPLDGNPYGPDLASALWDQGIDIRLLVPLGFRNQERTKCPYEEVSPGGGRGQWVRKLIEETRYLHRVWRLARQWRPDVVHVQWLRMKQEVHLIPMLRSLGIPIVITAHNVFPHEPGPSDEAHHRRYFGTADRVIAHEPSTRADLIRVLGLPPEKVDVVPHGILEDAAPTLDRATARRRIGIEPSATTFLLFGGLRPYKGHDTLVRAFRQAGGGGQLVLGGWGTRRSVQELHDWVGSFESETRERIHLRLNEDAPLPHDIVNDLFAACDCVALPYRSISQSGVLFQAFYHERPVLASSVGGFRHVIEDGFNGRLLEPEDEPGWAHALTTLSLNPDVLQDWGRNGRRRALEQCGYTRVALETIATYERAIGRAAGV